MNARFSPRLLVVAWAIVLLWFWLATMGCWGYTPCGMLWWILPAGPLGITTWRMMAQAGTPVSRKATACILVGGFFLLLLQVLLAVVGDDPLGDRLEPYLNATSAPLMIASALFPIAVTGWVVWEIARMRRAAE